MLRSKCMMCAPHSINHDSLPSPTTWQHALCLVTPRVRVASPPSPGLLEMLMDKHIALLFLLAFPPPFTPPHPHFHCVCMVCLHSHTFLCGWGCAYTTTYIQRSEVKSGCHSSLSALRQDLLIFLLCTNQACGPQTSWESLSLSPLSPQEYQDYRWWFFLFKSCFSLWVLGIKNLGLHIWTTNTFTNWVISPVCFSHIYLMCCLYFCGLSVHELLCCCSGLLAIWLKTRTSACDKGISPLDYENISPIFIHSYVLFIFNLPCQKM